MINWEIHLYHLLLFILIGLLSQAGISLNPARALHDGKPELFVGKTACSWAITVSALLHLISLHVFFLFIALDLELTACLWSPSALSPLWVPFLVLMFLAFLEFCFHLLFWSHHCLNSFFSLAHSQFLPLGNIQVSPSALKTENYP